MKLFALAEYCKRSVEKSGQDEIICVASWATATSIEEAIGIGISEIKLLRKQKNGWRSHACVAVEIPPSTLSEVLYLSTKC